jgi:hypothetical protein
MVLKMILRGGYIDVFEKKCSSRRLNDSFDVVCLVVTIVLEWEKRWKASPVTTEKHTSLFIFIYSFWL